MAFVTLRPHECLCPKNARGVPNQAFLALIRAKGAPVIGVTLLAYDPDYEFSHQFDDDAGTLTVSWTDRAD